jgi:hypothetical protein
VSIAAQSLQLKTMISTRSPHAEAAAASPSPPLPLLSHAPLASPYGLQQQQQGIVLTMNDRRCNARYSDLTSAKRRNFETSLNNIRNDAKDWRLLAKELDFSEASIKSFAVLGEQKCGPSRHLLQSWHKRDGRRATVGALVMALIRIGRLDSALILDPTCLLCNDSNPLLPPPPGAE